jgi:GT2 family glycosyltransferase
MGSDVSSTPSDRQYKLDGPLPPLPPGAPGLTSVVTVNFNAGPLLIESARAVLASTAPVELIVVDNGSADGSVAALRAAVADPRLRVIETGANLGFARASNLGIRASRGDQVLLLNPDCIIEADTVERMREVMAGRPEVGMAGCLIRNPDGTEQAGSRRSVPTPWRSFVRTFGLARVFPQYRRLFDDFVLAGQTLPAEPVPMEAISGAFMLVRRPALDEVGLLDEGYFLHCEDLDWCMRFRRAGSPILFVPGVAVVHHKGHCGRDRPVRVLWHMHRGMIRFYGKFFRDQYPRPFMWAVYTGVWMRFGGTALRALARR